MAYYSLEPWGPERADLNAGIIASTLANIHRNSQKSEPFKPGDFMPRYGGDPIADDEDGMAPEKISALIGDLMARQDQRKERERLIREKRRAILAKRQRGNGAG